MSGRALLFVVLLAGSVSAQFDNQSATRRVTIRLVSQDRSVCDSTTRVTLTSMAGLVASGSPTSDCEIEFTGIAAGTYHLSVSGLHLAPFDAGTVAIDSSGLREIEVPIDSGKARNGAPASPIVGVSELNVPSNARKEFDKANELIEKRAFEKAIQRLNKAIAIYPAYTEAYNNLGVVYSRLGDAARESEVLEKALSTNDHFAPAYVNLGRVDIRTGKFSEAEAALNKANSLDPNDAMTLVLLAYVEFMNRHFDEAIATSRKAHSLPQGPHAFVHQVAARAFEQKHDGANAIAELELFLKEEQTGPRAEIARKELATLQAGVH